MKSFSAIGTRLALFGLLLVSLFSVTATLAGVSTPPIVKAAEEGDIGQVSKLLDRGADPNAHDAWRNTALIYAARDGRVEMVRLLIARGADVNWIDGERVTPLILASFKNHETIVRLLLGQNADRTVRDKWGRTALDYALRRGEDDPIALLLRKR